MQTTVQVSMSPKTADTATTEQKAQEVRHKILKQSTDPIVWLQAEVDVLREHLAANGMNIELYWEKVHAIIKARADRKKDKVNG